MRDDFGFFNAQFAAHAVVVKGAHRRGLHDVKAGQVATRVASIAVRHDLTVLELLDRHSMRRRCHSSGRTSNS